MNYIPVYNEAIQFYEEQLNSLKEASGEDIIEAASKFVLLQFCMICFQDMKSIYTLLQQKEFLAPQIILRHMVEFLFSWMYIEKAPRDRTIRFLLNNLKEKSKLFDDIKKYGWVGTAELESMKEKLMEDNILYNDLLGEGGKWPPLIERARDVGQIEMYDLVYRYLSKDSHPSSFNSHHFFSESPNGGFQVHPYNKDNTEAVIQQGLVILNSLMKVLNHHFALPNQDKYADLNERIESLHLNESKYDR